MRLRYLTRPLPPKAPPTALLALCSQEAGTFPLCSLPSSFLAPCTQSPHVHVSLFLIQGEPKGLQHPCQLQTLKPLPCCWRKPFPQCKAGSHPLHMDAVRLQNDHMMGELPWCPGPAMTLPRPLSPAPPTVCSVWHAQDQPLCIFYHGWHSVDNTGHRDMIAQHRFRRWWQCMQENLQQVIAQRIFKASTPRSRCAAAEESCKRRAK